MCFRIFLLLYFLPVFPQSTHRFFHEMYVRVKPLKGLSLLGHATTMNAMPALTFSPYLTWRKTFPFKPSIKILGVLLFYDSHAQKLLSLPPRRWCRRRKWRRHIICKMAARWRRLRRLLRALVDTCGTAQEVPVAPPQPGSQCKHRRPEWEQRMSK